MPGNAIATIYIPKDEDFGISPVESMSAGKPVIGAGDGGLLETIIHGKTGWLTPPNPSLKELIQAIKVINPKQALSMRENLRKTSYDLLHKKFHKEYARDHLLGKHGKKTIVKLFKLKGI